MFDAITVQMILNRAEVSRKTFYKYFSDKYELMGLFYKRYMDRNIRENYDGHNWDEILCALYDFVELDLPISEMSKISAARVLSGIFYAITATPFTDQ